MTFIVVALICMAPFLWFRHVTIWEYNAEFREYKHEFVLVKDYMLQMFPEGSGYVSVEPIKGNSNQTDRYYYALYDPKTKRYLDCPAEIWSALQILAKEAFPNNEGDLTVIRYEDGKISFCAEVAYALVYSPDEVPRSLGRRDKVYCRWAGGAWYHVRGR